MAKLRYFLLFACLISSGANAADVIVSLSGSAFEGGPAFSVSFGGEVIGTGTVEPIPADGTGIDFAFKVDDTLLAGKPDLEILLTNDKYEAGVGDRNLRVLSASVNGVVFGQDQVKIVPEPTSRAPGLLASGHEAAVISAPAEGWPPSTGN